MLRDVLPETNERADRREHDGQADIVVTGMGAITPAGRGVDATWAGVLAGKPSAALDEVLVEAGVQVTLACRVPAFDADAELGRGTSRRHDRYTQLALLAAREAVQHAGLVDARIDPDRIVAAGVDPDRVGVLLGSGIGGAEAWSETYSQYLDKGPGRVSALFIPKMLSNTAAGAIAMATGARGPNLTVNTACAAGASAIGTALLLLRSGAVDVVLAGGVEAGITPLSVAAFANMGALSKNDDPMTASRPFDVGRDGFVMGEGAAVLVLERADHATARGAKVLGRVAGYGASADAHHATAPPADGAGAQLAIQRALLDAGLTADDIGHVNAHGTSTPMNDAAETAALTAVLGDHLGSVPVTSTKGVTGHLLGAAGAVEAIIALHVLRDRLVPPTAGLRDQDSALALDVVTDAPRAHDVDAVLSNSFGFGGQNAALILTR
jgi:beta-ketoacyl-acyl-carrier-protein synthase II